MKYLYQKKVMTLASALFSKAFGTWSVCLKKAHQTMKEVNTSLVVFTKKDGTLCKRVVAAWNMFNEVKGTGRKTPEYLRLFADVSKVLVGVRNTISCYVGKYEIF